MGMIEIVEISNAEIRRLRSAPGDSVVVKGVGLGGAGREATLYQQHGFRSRPVDGSRGIFVPLGNGSREGIVIATENYTIDITLDAGGAAIYSTNAAGAVQAQIVIGADGKIAAKNSAETLATLIADLIDEISGASTTGSPVVHVMDAATQAALAALKTRFAALLEA